LKVKKECGWRFWLTLDANGKTQTQRPQKLILLREHLSFKTKTKEKDQQFARGKKERIGKIPEGGVASDDSRL